MNNMESLDYYLDELDRDDISDPIETILEIKNFLESIPNGEMSNPQRELARLDNVIDSVLSMCEEFFTLYNKELQC